MIGSEEKNAFTRHSLKTLYEKRLLPFIEEIAESKGTEQAHERLVVLKQLSGNVFFAIVMSIPFIIIACLHPQNNCWTIVCTVLLAVVLSLSLLCNHILAVREEDVLEEIALNRRG